MANQRVNDDDAQGKGVGQNELVPALRSVQEEVAEEEEKSNDKPQPGGEEFQRNHGVFAHNGREENPHQGPAYPVGQRMAEQALVHWKATHGPQDEQQQQPSQQWFGGQVNAEAANFHLLEVEAQRHGSYEKKEQNIQPREGQPNASGSHWQQRQPGKIMVNAQHDRTGESRGQ